MTETVYFGSSPKLTVRVTNQRGRDISAATITVGVAARHAGPPTTLRAPDGSTSPKPNIRLIDYIVDSALPLGEYILWVWVSDSGDDRPIRAGRFNVVLT